MFEPRIPEDLLEDGRGGALHQRHFRWNERPEIINNNAIFISYQTNTKLYIKTPSIVLLNT